MDEQDMVKGIVHQVNNNITTEIENYNSWLSSTKMSRRKQKRVELFFAVQTACSLRELIEEELRCVKKEKLLLEIKRTIDGHVHRIGRLTGAIKECVNVEWCEQTLSTLGNIRIEEFELKKIKRIKEMRRKSA